VQDKRMATMDHL